MQCVLLCFKHRQRVNYRTLSIRLFTFIKRFYIGFRAYFEYLRFLFRCSRGVESFKYVSWDKRSFNNLSLGLRISDRKYFIYIFSFKDTLIWKFWLPLKEFCLQQYRGGVNIEVSIIKKKIKLEMLGEFILD